MSLLFLSISTHCCALDIPEYSRVDNPSCSCSCQNKMVFKHLKASRENIIKWAEEAAITSLSYGFGNYKSALEHASQYYTRAGWEHFMEELLKSKNLEIIAKENILLM